MKTNGFRALSAIAAVLLSAQAYAADFEGKIEISISAPSSSAAAVGYIKGSLLKIMPEETAHLDNGVEGYPLIDFGKKTITLISPKEKYYMDMPLSQLENAIAKQGVKIKRSGLTETILGCAAEEWILDDTAAYPGTASLWITKDVSLSFNLLVSLQKSYPAEGLVLGRMAKELVAQRAFPLKAVVKDKDGKEKLRWQVLSLAGKELDEAELAVPKGYGKMSDVLKKNKRTGGR